jgi:hypothetical protein
VCTHRLRQDSGSVAGGSRIGGRASFTWRSSPRPDCIHAQNPR